jgi:hypothetical protein
MVYSSGTIGLKEGGHASSLRSAGLYLMFAYWSVVMIAKILFSVDIVRPINYTRGTFVSRGRSYQLSNTLHRVSQKKVCFSINKSFPCCHGC